MSQRGNAMIMALVTVGIVGFVSLIVGSWNKYNSDILKQSNLASSALQIRNKVMNLVTSPYAWTFVVNNNSSVFYSATQSSYENTPLSQKMINLYSADSAGSGTLYYQTTDPTAGFDMYGNPCSGRTEQHSPGGYGQSSEGGFNAESGNNRCPFRYNVYLLNRVFRNGSWIDTVRFEMKFKPETSKLILNANTLAYSFDLVRNFSAKSVESSCIAIGGQFNPSNGMCSQMLTPPINCGTTAGYKGPQSPYCQTFQLSFTCPGGLVTGFGNSGTPFCRTSVN